MGMADEIAAPHRTRYAAHRFAATAWEMAEF